MVFGRLCLLTDLAKKVFLNLGRAELGALRAAMTVPDSQQKEILNWLLENERIAPKYRKENTRSMSYVKHLKSDTNSGKNLGQARKHKKHGNYSDTKTPSKSNILALIENLSS